MDFQTLDYKRIIRSKYWRMYGLKYQKNIKSKQTSSSQYTVYVGMATTCPLTLTPKRRCYTCQTNSLLFFLFLFLFFLLFLFFFFSSSAKTGYLETSVRNCSNSFMKTVYTGGYVIFIQCRQTPDLQPVLVFWWFSCLLTCWTRDSRLLQATGPAVVLNRQCPHKTGCWSHWQLLAILLIGGRILHKSQ